MNHASQAVAIADILDRDMAHVDRIEGLLLVASGSGETITPVTVAQETGLGREAAANLFRQLETADAVARTSYGRHIAESQYSAQSETVRRLFDLVRDAVRLIEADRNRQPPPTEAEPLVTFPEDPAFADITPSAFGMNQLLSALASEIKDTTDDIVLVAPFFEGAGFNRLYDVLGDALERGVDLTVVTRYLADESSHNREVLKEFIDYLAAERDATGNIRTVDYTVWDEEVPAGERRQDGARPAFTLHAKVMLFDGDTAYVGSANVTDYGFDRYLEVGVLLRGPPASKYCDLCEFLLDSDGATQVDL
jgi:putative cardiolipin synthase